jgi:hypothetical protein
MGSRKRLANGAEKARAILGEKKALDTIRVSLSEGAYGRKAANRKFPELLVFHGGLLGSKVYTLDSIYGIL